MAEPIDFNSLHDNAEPISDTDTPDFNSIYEDPGADKLKGSMFVGTQKNPEHYAKVLDLAGQLKIPASFVEPQYEMLKKRKDLFDLDPVNFNADFPKLSKWMTPENAGVAHDDLDSLKRIESSVGDYSFTSDLYNKLNKGIASFYAGAARIPAFVNQAALLPYNLTLDAQGKMTGRPDLFEPYKYQASKEGFLNNNPLTRYLDRSAEEYENLVSEKSLSATDIFKAADNGDYRLAGRQLALALAENLPTVAVTAGAAFGGLGLAGAGVSAGVSGSQANLEGLEAGVDPTAQSLNALANTGFEYFGEKLFTVLPIERIISKYGKTASNEIFKWAGITIAGQGVSEGIGEGATQIGQSLSSFLTNVNPDALNTIGADTGLASILGAIMGGGVSAPGAILAGVSKSESRARSKNTEKTYINLGQAANESNLKERSPEKLESAIEAQTKDTPIEKIYISPESFDTYFQGKGDDPTEILKNLDSIDAYDTAKETGTKMAIPTSVWTARLSNENYLGLKDDVSYDSNQESANEVKAINEEINEASNEAIDAVPEEDAAVTALRERTRAESIAAGRSKAEADFNSDLVEARVTTRADILGETVAEQVAKREITIQAGTAPSPDALNQLAPVFFSKLEMVFQEKLPNSASVEQVNSILKEVKVEEREFSGIDEFLKGKKKVSKEELINFIKGNQLNIKEITKGDPVLEKLEILEKEDGWFLFNGTEILDGPFSREMDAEHYRQSREKENSSNQPKFSEYTLPGGDKNYREISFILPEGDKGKSFQSTHHDEKNVFAHTRVNDREDLQGNKVLFIEEIQSDWHQEGRKRGYQIPLTAKEAEEAKDAKEKIELLQARRLVVEGERSEALRKVTDLVIGVESEIINQLVQTIPGQDVDPRAVSNMRHYIFGVNPAGDWRSSIKIFYKNEDIIDQIFLIIKRENFNTAINQYKKLDDELTSLLDEYRRIGSEIHKMGELKPSRVPNAPFKKTWQDFVLKRLIREASEKGYKRISWTTGDQQNERYDLAKSVNYIKAKKNNDGTFFLDISVTNGRDIQQENLNPSQLESLVGKSLALKITNESGEKKGEFFKYQGEDLRLGGAGMRGFYDKILVDAANKIGKSFGAKVEDIELSSTEKVHSMEITPELRDSALKSGFPLFQGESNDPRGQVRISNSQAIIDIFKGSDQSTIPHEFSHIWLKELAEDAGVLSSRDPASLTNKQKRLLEDSQTALNFLGLESWDKLDSVAQEKWADAYESYLKDGKSPSVKLRKAFRAFSKWLTDIFRKANNSGVQVGPELRSVFNRLLASEEQILEVEQMQNYKPIFTDQSTSGMGEAQWAEYQAAQEEATAYATEILQQEMLEDLNKIQRAEYKERKAGILKEVTNRVNQSPVYNALSILKDGEYADGRPFDNNNEFPVKLSKAEINSEYISGLPKGIFNEEIGMPVDMVAEILGFSSGDDLLQSLANAENKKELIEKEVNQTMREIFPDLFNSPKVSEEAMKAVHNDQRARVLRIELEFLSEVNFPLLKSLGKKLIRRAPSQKVINDQASVIIGKQKVSDISPRAYELAERKHAKLAGDLFFKGDISGAFESKRKEALNHALYRQAVSARNQINKSVKKFRKISRITDEKAVDLKRDSNLVNAAKSIISNFGLGTKTAKTTEKYLELIEAYDPEAHASLIEMIESVDITPTQYTQLSFNEFQKIKEAVNALWALSKEYGFITIDGKKLEKEKAIGMLQSQIDETFGKHSIQDEAYKGSLTNFQKVKNAALSYFSATRSVEHWVDSIDLGNISGSFRKIILNPIFEAIDAYKKDKTIYGNKLLEILKPVLKNISTKDIIAYEMPGGSPFRFRGKAELLGAIMHRGNESNFSKFIRGYGWGQFNEDGTLDTSAWSKFEARMIREGVLTKEDYDAIQQVWDLYEELKPGIQKAHFKRYGRYFNEVTANEFNTPFGTYRGGYAPAMADPNLVQRQEYLQNQNLMDRLTNSSAWPSAGSGSTKTRNEAYAAPLLLDLRAINYHLDWALRFSNLQNPVMEVARIIYSKEFNDMITKFDLSAVNEMLKPWLKRTAQQAISTPSENKNLRNFDIAAKYIRQSTTLQFLSLNIVNASQNLVNIGPILLVVKPAHLKRSLVEFIKHPLDFVEEIANKSQFMSTLLKDDMMKVAGETEALLSTNPTLDTIKNYLRNGANIFNRLTQTNMNAIVFSAAYNQAVDQGYSDKDAVRFGDSAVRTTQAVGGAENLTNMEVGTEKFKLITMFTRFFINLMNLTQSKSLIALRKSETKLQATPKVAHVIFMTFFSVGILSEVIRRLGYGEGLDADDDDEYLDDLLFILFGAPLRVATAAVPLGSLVVNAVINRFDDKYYNDSITVSPVLSAVESAIRAPLAILKIGLGEEVRKKDVRDIFTLLGIVTNLPVLPLARPVGYLLDIEAGKAKPSGPIDFTRGILTGQPGSKK